MKSKIQKRAEAKLRQEAHIAGLNKDLHHRRANLAESKDPKTREVWAASIASLEASITASEGMIARFDPQPK